MAASAIVLLLLAAAAIGAILKQGNGIVVHLVVTFHWHWRKKWRKLSKPYLFLMAFVVLARLPLSAPRDDAVSMVPFVPATISIHPSVRPSRGMICCYGICLVSGTNDSLLVVDDGRYIHCRFASTNKVCHQKVLLAYLDVNVCSRVHCPLVLRYDTAWYCYFPTIL